MFVFSWDHFCASHIQTGTRRLNKSKLWEEKQPQVRTHHIIFVKNDFNEKLDWVEDKVRSKFAFAAMCWEKSYIPLAIWKAGDSTSNLIESVHADVNREGVRCTLVGGIKKGASGKY